MWVHIGSILCLCCPIWFHFDFIFRPSNFWFFSGLCSIMWIHFSHVGISRTSFKLRFWCLYRLTAFAWIQFGCVLGPLESSWSSFPEHTCLEHLRCDFYAKTEGGGPSRQRNSSSISTKKNRSPIAREKNILVVVTIRIFRNALIMFERKHSITF